MNYTLYWRSCGSAASGVYGYPSVFVDREPSHLWKHMRRCSSNSQYGKKLSAFAAKWLQRILKENKDLVDVVALVSADIVSCRNCFRDNLRLMEGAPKLLLSVDAKVSSRLVVNEQ